MVSLLRALLHWWANPRPKAVDLDSAFAARISRVGQAAALLPNATVDAIRGVAYAFLRHVYDLPASERHHHSQPFGLFDHSLEVAGLAVRAADAEPLSPRLRLATWWFGLLHDVGKVVYLTVQGPRGDVWNPYYEPLADFYSRHGRDRSTLAWIRGRGLEAHEWQTPYMIGKLIACPAVRLLGPDVIREVIDQKTPAARTVQRLVRAADRASVARALASRQPSPAPPSSPESSP